MKNKKILTFLIIFASCNIGLLSGCKKAPTNINYTYIPTSQIPGGPDHGDAQAQLAETALTISNSMEQISSIQLATHPYARIPETNARVLGMTQITSVDWFGPVEPLLKKIAEVSNYRLRILGKSPAIPVLVSIYSRDEILANVLRNITYQVQSKADIVTYPRARLIELRYHPE